MHLSRRPMRSLLLALGVFLLTVALLPASSATAQGTTAVLTAQYYANRDLSGPVIFSETLPASYLDGPYIKHEWLWGLGPQNGVPDDLWSARFVTEVTLASGNVKFMLNSDDGSRIFLNGQPIIDEWHERVGTYYTSRVLPIPAGRYSIVVEYYDTGGINLLEARFEPTTDLPSAPDVNFVPAPLPGTPTTVPPGGATPTSPTLPTGGPGGGGIGIAAIPPAEGVVVDSNSLGFTWAGSNQWGFGFGGLIDNLYLFTGNSSFVQRLWARWNPFLPASGSHSVYVWIPVNPNATTNARYRVFHAGILSPVIQVNQRSNGGQWVYLGTFNFNQGANQYLFLNDLTFEAADSTWVLFDAVKFSFSTAQ